MAIKTYQTRHGPMLAFEGDEFLTPALEKQGEYAPQEWAILKQLTARGMSVAEIGANIGCHSVPLAKRCAPGPIHLFEPQQRVFQVLCANLALNGVGNALAYPEACGEADGEAVVPPVDYDGRENFGGVALQSAQAAGCKVRVVALDSLELPTLSLLKIDVEGFEPQVLRGARRTIARCRPVIYLENDRPAQQGEVIELLAAMDYRLFWHTPLIADPSVFDGHALVSINMCCFPKEVPMSVTGAQEVDPHNWASPLARQGPAPAQ